jgi:hypothetical protein
VGGFVGVAAGDRQKGDSGDAGDEQFIHNFIGCLVYCLTVTGCIRAWSNTIRYNPTTGMTVPAWTPARRIKSISDWNPDRAGQNSSFAVRRLWQSAGNQPNTYPRNTRSTRKKREIMVFSPFRVFRVFRGYLSGWVPRRLNPNHNPAFSWAFLSRGQNFVLYPLTVRRWKKSFGFSQGGGR